MFSYQNRLNPGRLFFLLGFFFFLHSKSQVLNNLVPNYSAENYTACPNNFGEIFNTSNWFKASYWGTADYYNSCATATLAGVPNNAHGSRTARSGNAYFGIFVYAPTFTGREDIETQLTQALESNKIYCVTFFVSLAQTSWYGISNLGAHLTNDSLKNYYPVPPLSFYFLNPSIENDNTNIITDTTQWVQIQKTYTANGGERFITITNFRNDANTNKIQISNIPNPVQNGSYYYIDDISVVEINPAKAYPTKTITTCANATFTLGTDSTWDAMYQWQPTTGLSCTNCPNPIITVTANAKYVLTKQQCSATTKDSVYIQIYTPTLTANAGNFKSICINDTIKLGTNDTTSFTSYFWQPLTGLNCTNCPQPLTTPFTTTTYTLTKTECSLTTSDTVSVYVDACEVIIPDIFTPNNDNANDEWKIKLPQGFKLNAVSVYNRWGTLIYTIDDSVLNSEKSKVRVINWDGRTTSGMECSEGVYFYVIHYTDKNGILKEINGTITLMR